jgi:small subunit ribosomal protein S7e
VEAESAPTTDEKEVRHEEVLGAQNGRVKSKEPISAGLFTIAAGLDKFVKENATIKFEADLPESPQEDGELEDEAEGSGLKRRAAEVAPEAVEASTEDPEAPEPPTKAGHEVDETKQQVGSTARGLKEKPRVEETEQQIPTADVVELHTGDEVKYKLCKVRAAQFGDKGVPHITTFDGRTIRYLDPLIKANDTVKINLETGKVVEFIKFDIKGEAEKAVSAHQPKVDEAKDTAADAEGQEPDEFEESVAQALFDLESTNTELKSKLRDLFINSAKEVDVSGNRKAVIIHVPYRLRKAFQKVHARLVRELKKKFSGKDVVVISTRRILRPPKKGSAVNRPRSRTLTSVHEAILEDLIYPSEIVGKRVRYRLDGSRIMRVYLDPKEHNSMEVVCQVVTRGSSREAMEWAIR